ncbi:MAG: hypothetical protein ACFFD6_11920 [Candidatus Thorarchaeota archaeon]
MNEGGALDQTKLHKSNIIGEPDLIARGHSRWSMKLILITWIGTLGFDFLWHGGFLSEIYNLPNPALLDLEQAFARIPLGYGSLLIQVVLFYWLFLMIGVEEWQKGLRIGLMFGGLMGIASILGQYSILTLELGILILWSMGQVFEFGAMGMILGAGISATSLKSMAARIVALVILAIVFGIILQSEIH